MNSTEYLANPHQYTIDQILEKDDKDNEFKFTKNVVDVQIEGKELTDLVVTDLPGLIQSVDEDDDKK